MHIFGKLTSPYVIGVQDFGQVKNYKPTWTKTCLLRQNNDNRSGYFFNDAVKCIMMPPQDLEKVG